MVDPYGFDPLHMYSRSTNDIDSLRSMRGGPRDKALNSQDPFCSVRGGLGQGPCTLSLQRVLYSPIETAFGDPFLPFVMCGGVRGTF